MLCFVTLFSQVRLEHLVVCGRADDGTGGVKDEKELWLACQSTAPARVDVPTAPRQCCVLFF